MPIEHVAGVDLYYETSGSSGDPVVLVHGSLADHTAWSRVVPLLSESLTVLTYDRRGYGRSTRGPRDHPVGTDASDLAALLEAVDWRPVHVIAHSYAGAVALELASQRPELVRSLVVHEPPLVGLLDDDPATAGASATFRSAVQAISDRVRAGDSEGAARQVTESFSTTPGAWERLPATVRSEFAGRMDRWVEEYDDRATWDPPREEFADLWLPVLLTSGTTSPDWVTAARRALAHRLVNATEVELRGAGHAPHVTHPVEYAGVVLSFLLERNVPSH